MINFLKLISILRYSLRCRQVRYAMYAMIFGVTTCSLIMLLWWGPAKLAHANLIHNIDAIRALKVEALRVGQVARGQREALPAVTLLEKKLEAHSGQAELMQGISRLASKRGVRVVSQAFNEGKAENGDAPLYLELGLSGDYTALRRLTGDLATLPMWIEIVEEHFERASESGPLVKLQMRLLTYRGSKGQ